MSLRERAPLTSGSCALTAVWCRSEGPAVTLEVLRSLAAVGRFDMAVMFMSSAERKGGVPLVAPVAHTAAILFFSPHPSCLLCSLRPTVVSDLFDVLRQAELEASVVAALQKKYGL